MCGSDTLAMLVSSSSMKVAIVTVMAISHGLIAGFAWAGASASVGAGGASRIAVGMVLKETVWSQLRRCYHKSDQSVSHRHETPFERRRSRDDQGGAHAAENRCGRRAGVQHPRL